LPYYEAMAFKKPIFTSNLDFARDGCGNSAIYFDPFDAEDIVNKIEKNINLKNTLLELTDSGYKKYTQIPSWNEVIKEYNICINMVLNGQFED
jgi:glycosyltransferase involved in cell wall biosynthesis